MITAKEARDGTNVDEYVRGKLADIGQSISVCMKLGVSYYRYIGSLPDSIKDMLLELGYKIDETEDMFTGERVIISWGKPSKDVTCS
jgi:hypothetical protein